VHVHPHYTTIFATAEVELVPMGILALRVPTLLKGVGIAKFAMPGSSELAENLVEGIAGRDAVLMPHHGVTTVGKTIESAAKLAEAVEDLAKFQFELMQIGTPRPLPLDPKLMARLSNL